MSTEKNITAAARLLALKPENDGKPWMHLFDTAARELVPDEKQRYSLMLEIVSRKNFKRLATRDVPDDSQVELFPTPTHIDIDHPQLGLLLVDTESDYCLNESMDAWEKKNRTHHDVQFHRFDRRQNNRKKAIDGGLEIPTDAPWRTARAMLNKFLTGVVAEVPLPSVDVTEDSDGDDDDE